MLFAYERPLCAMSGRSMTVEMLERIVVAPGRLLITIAGTTKQRGPNDQPRVVAQIKGFSG